MAGFTDYVFRELCKREGADVLVSEFVLADALLRGSPQIWEEVDFSESQRPMGVQIFGCSPGVMAKAAQSIAQKLRPDFVDLNFGCPSDKVTCRDAGSSLLRNPPKLASIAKMVVDSMRTEQLPVTAKIRIGWDEQSIVALDVAKRLEDAGVECIAIHGRTKEQGYRGMANWEVIESVARSVRIPVIGNGNITSAGHVAALFGNSAVSGIMIGRAALGYPWIFREIKETLRTGQAPLPPTLEERWETLLTYAALLLQRPHRDRRDGDIRWMRPRLIKLTKDMTGSRRIRGDLQNVTTLSSLQSLAKRHIDSYHDADLRVRQEKRERQLSINSLQQPVTAFSFSGCRPHENAS